VRLFDASGKSAADSQRKPDASTEKPRPTFGQIYKSVEAGDFESVREGDLYRLDPGEVSTLESLVERRIEQFTALAREQRDNPKFKPPKGVKDQVFKNVVREFREFESGALARTVERSERLQRAVSTFDRRFELLLKEFEGQPIGDALSHQADLTREIVKAKATGGEFGSDYTLSDAALLRTGYLDQTGAIAVIDQPFQSADVGAGSDIQARIVTQIRKDKTVLAEQVARALVASTATDPDDIRSIANVVNRIAKDVRKGENIATRRLQGHSPTNAENVLHDELLYLAKDPRSVAGAFFNPHRSE